MIKTKKPWDVFFLPLIAAILFTISYDICSSLRVTYHEYPSQIGNSEKKYSVLLITSNGMLAELQESHHNCVAINNLGSDCYIFSYSDHIRFNFLISWLRDLFILKTNSDFVFFQLPHLALKPSKVPQYAALDIARPESVSFVTRNLIDDKTLRNMSYFDAFVVYGSKQKWSQDFLQALRKKNPSISNAVLFDYYPSISSTDFQPGTYTKLVYFGNNWDKLRASGHYIEIYKKLDETDYFRAYGPPSRWPFLKYNYAGIVNQDKFTLLSILRKSGIALLLHSDYHLERGIPSKRVFEAAAAGAVMISDKHPFVVREFGDCAYYIDFQKKTEEVVNEINTIVNNLRTTPELGHKKASCAHSIFMEKFKLENQWRRIFEMHQNVISSKH